PGCGILHSLNASFHCNFRTAWHANPSGLVLALALVFQVGGRALMLQGLPLSLNLENLDTWFARVFGILAVAVWVYRISIKFAEGGIRGHVSSMRYAGFPGWISGLGNHCGNLLLSARIAGATGRPQADGLSEVRQHLAGLGGQAQHGMLDRLPRFGAGID